MSTWLAHDMLEATFDFYHLDSGVVIAVGDLRCLVLPPIVLNDHVWFSLWEHGNTKVPGLAGLSAKSGYFRVTLVSSRDSVKCRRLRTLQICLFVSS
jgi:hypothetical protein